MFQTITKLKLMLLGLIYFFNTLVCFSQNVTPAEQFFQNLKKHCGKAYEGKAVSGADNDTFRDKSLKMQVIYCSDTVIKIPFYVGDDKSRTWILTLVNNKIELKHDHRHEDGTDDKVTKYGGTATNQGSAILQMFPADEHTAQMLPAAANNVWWITLENDRLAYNLRRIGSDRLFSVSFDLSKEITLDWKPWGWK